MSATSTGTDARITCGARAARGPCALSALAASARFGFEETWFMESSMTVSDALLHAIWKPFMTATAEMPFQPCRITSECFEA